MRRLLLGQWSNVSFVFFYKYTWAGEMQAMLGPDIAPDVPDADSDNDLSIAGFDSMFSPPQRLVHGGGDDAEMDPLADPSNWSSPVS